MTKLAGDRQPWVRALWDLLFLAAVPMGFAVLWTRFADAQKELNPEAQFLVSGALQAWNFGTVEDRLSAETWFVILGRVPMVVDPLVLAVGLVAAGVARRFRGLCLACLGMYLLGPLVFVRLHYWHEYYAYSNALFLVAAAGVGIASLVDRGPVARRVCLLLLPLVFAVECWRHWQHYLPMQETNAVYAADLGRVIDEALGPDEILLGLGLNWSPEVPYYSRRRALMLRGTPRQGLERLEAALDQLGEYRPGAVVVGNINSEPLSAADLERAFAERGWMIQNIFADDKTLIYRLKSSR